MNDARFDEDIGPETPSEVNRPIQISLKFPPAEVAEIKAAARKLDRSIASFARIAIREYVKRVRTNHQDS